MTKKSQKEMKNLMSELKTELIGLTEEVTFKSNRAKIVHEMIEENKKELQKVCKHKNRSTECKMVSRRLDYMDWEEPRIFYKCLDCEYNWS